MTDQKTIAFQGAKGAYSHMACQAVFPNDNVLPCITFDGAFEAVKSKAADFAVIPIDNTLAGRVADVHHLLPESGLSIIGEHFQKIRHNLLGVKGTDLSKIQTVHSHVHALPQCRNFIKNKKLSSVVHADTAGAAAQIAEEGKQDQAAIASQLAAEIYDLDILAADIQDDHSNTTRFIVLSRDNVKPPIDQANVLTSFIFEVRHIPAALFKAMGGFATNNVNMVKLESYVDSQFKAAQFYCEVEGHIESDNVKLALEELNFFASHVKILGCFLKSNFREEL